MALTTIFRSSTTAAGLLLDYPSARVRLVLRVYFTAVLAVLAVIGDRCCNNRVKISLLRKSAVSVGSMTGWLRGPATAKATIMLRTLPSRWHGLLMLLAAALSLTTDLAVSGLVTTITATGQCSFSLNGTYSVMLPSAPYFIGPVNAGQTYKMIERAQTTSLNNGGIDGIYAKVNEDPAFRATEVDILGRWQCVDVGSDRTYAASVEPNLIFEDLTLQKFLFPDSSRSCWQTYPDNSTTHMVFWSAPQPSRPSALWTVRASVSMVSDPHTDRLMRSFECDMQAPTIDWLLQQTMPDTVFET